MSCSFSLTACPAISSTTSKEQNHAKIFLPPLDAFFTFSTNQSSLISLICEELHSDPIDSVEPSRQTTGLVKVETVYA